MALFWTGTHAYRDHAGDQTIESGEEIPEDIADRISASHPRDVDEREDDDGGWAEEDWLAGDYGERADAVADGRVDDHLDEIEAVETSDTVIEAVENRRAELTEE